MWAPPAGIVHPQEFARHQVDACSTLIVVIRSVASFLLIGLLVAALAWGNCARCTDLVPAPSAPESHACCKKSGSKPAPKPCQMGQAELAKAVKQIDANLAAIAEPVSTDAQQPVASPVARITVVRELQSSPPPLHLLFAVFLI